jgi:hypothetical protein
MFLGHSGKTDENRLKTTSKNSAKMNRYAFCSEWFWGFFCRSPYIKKTPNPIRSAESTAFGEISHHTCFGAGSEE